MWLHWCKSRDGLAPGVFELGATWCCAPAGGHTLVDDTQMSFLCNSFNLFKETHLPRKVVIACARPRKDPEEHKSLRTTKAQTGLFQDAPEPRTHVDHSRK